MLYDVVKAINHDVSHSCLSINIELDNINHKTEMFVDFLIYYIFEPKFDVSINQHQSMNVEVGKHHDDCLCDIHWAAVTIIQTDR